MPVLDFASSILNGLTEKNGRKYSKNIKAEIPDQENYILDGSSFYCGFSSATVMPDDIDKKNYWMAGYNIAKKVKGVLDPITINAMWLDCNDGKGIVFVSADIIGLTGYDVGDIRASLDEFCNKTGCVSVIISCTHTHAGFDTVGYWGVLPKSGKSSKYMLMIKATIKALCYSAYKSKKRGKLFYGFVHVPELAYDWREPEFFDDRLSRLRFVPDDGSDETWYLNFTAHPNTLGNENKKISADYPCYMRRRIHENKNVNILYSVGAIGAIDLAHIMSDRYERTVKGGRMLGEKALSIDNDLELKPNIIYSRKNFFYPIENNVLSFMEMLHVINANKSSYDSVLGKALISEINYLKFDGLSILTIPGEIFPELVYPGHYSTAENSSTGESEEINPITLSEICGDKNLVIFGVTNDMTGYIIPPNDFVLNKTQPYLNTTHDRFGRYHYNETNSLGPASAQIIADTFSSMIENLNENLLLKEV